MPKVPVYQEQVRLREARAPEPKILDPIQGAFGTEVAAAQAKMAEQVMKTADVIQTRLQEIRKRDDDEEVLDRYTSFQREAQDLLHNAETDESGEPAGLLNRELGQVKNITLEYDGKMGAMQRKYLDSVRGVDQKRALEKLLNSAGLAGREQVLTHEARQRSLSYDRALKTALDNAEATAAGTADPAALGRLISPHAEALRNSLLGLKLEKEDVEYQVRQFNGRMVKRAFNSVLDSNPRQAERILTMHEPAMLPSDAAALRQRLDGKLAYDENAAFYARVRGWRSEDGFPDAARMIEEARRQQLPPQRIEQLVRYVEGRAAEDRTNIVRGRSEQQRGFANQVLDAKRRGASLDEALRIVPDFAFDMVDAQTKETYVRKLYAGPHETDPTAFMGLWEGIQNRIVTREEIDRALSNGLIKPSDWEELRKTYFRLSTSGASPEDKDAAQRVKLFADENIHNKRDRDAFLYMWQEGSRGKAPAERLAYAQDLMKSHDPRWWKPSPREYKVQLQALDADQAQIGRLYQTIGQDEMNAVARGILFTTKKPKWSMADFSAFAGQFGGPDKILPGTPVHNAIQSLARHGKLVTAETVRKALEHRPDGKF